MPDTSLAKFDQPLWIELRPSAQLSGLAVAVHLLAALAWWLAPVPVWQALLASACLAIHFAYFRAARVQGRGRGSLCGLGWDRQRGWRLCGSDQHWQAATLLTPVFVTHQVVAVRFRCGRWRRRSAIILADRLPADAFRRLRVRLLQCAHEPGTRSQDTGAQ
jgi:hypothetical protein